MSGSRNRWWLLIIVCVVVVAVFYFLYVRPIPPPQGDGTFQDLSGWAGPIRDRGYHVKFPEFDLSLPFQSEYRISGLQNVGDRCGLYLVLVDAKGDWPWERDHRHVGGRLTLRLLKSNGEVVINVSGPLGAFIWWGFKDKHALYQKDDRSHFYPDPRLEYMVKIDYRPAPELHGMRGYVYLNTGAKYSGSRYR